MYKPYEKEANQILFTPQQKAQIVLEILKEDKSISQLSSEHGIHANVLQRWKSEAVRTCISCSSMIAEESPK